MKRKTTRWLGSLDVPHAVSYLEDMAVGLATLGERDEADGQIWHLPVNATLTGREFLTAVWQANCWISSAIAMTSWSDPSIVRQPAVYWTPRTMARRLTRP